MGACSGTHEPRHGQARPVAAVAPASDSLRLDVPALLKLSIDEMSQRLGPFQSVQVGFVDPAMAPLVQHGIEMDSTALFHSQGLTLVVTYNYPSRKVSDLLLLGTNENELMHRARLRLDARHYLVLPVFQQRPVTQLLGVRVLAISLNE